jgi:hypothetical protein
MKKKSQISAFCLFTFFLLTMQTKAQLKLIHYWTFNNATVPSAGTGWDGTAGNYSTETYSGYPADYTTLGNAKIVYKAFPGTVTNYSASVMDNYIATDVDTLNRRSGFGGCCLTPNYSVRAKNPSDSMELLFYIPTTKYRNIIIKYETEPSSLTSGQATQLFSYSTDSAASWQTSGLAQVSDAD